MSVQQLQARVDRDRAAMESAMRWHRMPDGSEVRIARFGAGPPLVCVPTVPEIDFVYMRQIEHLAERYTVFLHQPRLDRTRRVSLAQRHGELESVLDLLDVGPVHLLAWSDAGAVAYRAVRRRPERFRSLAVLGLADRYVFPQPVHAFARLIYRRPIERTVPSVTVAALLAWFLGGPRFSRRWLFGEARRIERLPQYLKHSILPLMLEHAPEGDGVPIPAVLVGGDHDAVVPVERMRRMTALLGRQAEFVLIPEGEHMLGYVAPQPVNEALDAFYARVETVPATFAGAPR